MSDFGRSGRVSVISRGDADVIVSLLYREVTFLSFDSHVTPHSPSSQLGHARPERRIGTANLVTHATQRIRKLVVS